ncbi:MAG: pyridoxamine 5'-phosphate oxidase [bacterium]|nr:pyridoxamine 5'-phosphate oxidase [bacterium]MDE0351934.1 pyridoxamine 5'-phosphate oxidase [bacterium]
MVDRRMARLREEYETEGLSMREAHPDPIRQFDRWFNEAVDAGVPQANAMTVGTADDRGRPSARVVLLKGYDLSGFVFYTNLGSRKSEELTANPRAALCFLWLELHRQVRIEGPVEVVGDADSDEYFASRPRGARIAAAASPQSREISGRLALERLVTDKEAEYQDGEVPRPAHWGGWRVRPERFEFWQGRRHRLHDRVVYLADGDGWRRVRLAP